MANTIARFQTAVNAEHLKSPASRGNPNHLEVTVAHDPRGNGLRGFNKHKVMSLKDFEEGTLNLFPVASVKTSVCNLPKDCQLLGKHAGQDLYTNMQLHITGCTSLPGDAAAKAATDDEFVVPYWCVRSTSVDAEANMEIVEFVSKSVAGSVTIPVMTNMIDIGANTELKYFLPMGETQRYPTAKRRRTA